MTAPPPDPGAYRGLALIGTAVGEMVVPVVIGAALDGRFGWSPWGAAAGAVLGIGGAVAHLLLSARGKPPGGSGTTGR